ncbi:peptidase S1 [Bacillus sp. T33-2]|nr:trypsin-like peptidase domain-containing protein [Bacillus sp. T33-2]PLR96805.1 peptidase S1 [Bacillus sp. T33-2]
MIDLEKTEDIQSRESVKRENNRVRKGKGFLSTITAGVIGSLLTLAVAPNTPYFQNYYSQAEQKSAAIAGQAKSDGSPVNAIPVKTSAKSDSASLADIVEQASKAIVGVVNVKQLQNPHFSGSSQAPESGSGSGVIFKKTTDSAYIVTNNHVIEGASQIEISLYNGEKTTAELIGADALTDLAVLKVDSKFAPAILEFGDSSGLRPGDQVLAIGNPLGLELSRTVTQGIISATNRSIPVSTSAGNWELNVIQTDAAINPGNSGGALINTEGKVVGINSLKISENGVEGLGFAIPTNDVVPIVNEIIDDGQVKRPYIGVSLADVAEVPRQYLQNLPDNVGGGTMVTYIDGDSAASKAGLQVNDIIISIDDTNVTNSSELRKYLYSKVKIGDEITLKVYRQGKLTTVKVKLTGQNVTD